MDDLKLVVTRIRSEELTQLMFNYAVYDTKTNKLLDTFVYRETARNYDIVRRVAHTHPQYIPVFCNYFEFDQLVVEELLLKFL